MSSCEYEIEVEDLAIGLLKGEEAEAARRHLEECATCQAAHEAFMAERSLFADRAHVAAPAPFTEPELVEAVVAASHAQHRAQVIRLARTVVAFAACAAAIVLSVWMNKHVIVDSSSAAAPASSAPSMSMSSTSSSVNGSSSEDDDQAMACAFPMSGSFHASDLLASSELEAPASISGVDHATCEAPLSSSGSSMLSWRVTSSFATP